jgi:hypothetical protein
MIAALAGIVRWTRACRRPEYTLFAAGQLALLLVWNYPANERFLLPLLPLLLMGLWTEFSHVGALARSARRSDKRAQRRAAALLIALLACGSVLFAAWNLYADLRVLPLLAAQERRSAAAAQPLYKWIRENTPASALFFAELDPSLYLHTGRQATSIRIPVRYFYTGDRAGILAESGRLAEFALGRRLDYLLLTPEDFDLDWFPEQQRRAAREAVARDPRFRAVYDSPAGTVVKVERRAE